MFTNLSDKLSKIFDRIKGHGFLNEEDVNGALREIRVALLEADVALPVVKEITERIRTKAIGVVLLKTVSPGQQVVKIVSDEITALLQAEEQQLNLRSQSPAVIMMVGLQGSGKTTTSAKLALKLKDQLKKKVLLASLDTYRPAAQKQLETVAGQIQVDSVEIIDGQDPIQISKRALKKAQDGLYDVLILDTAGRLHTDEELISELQEVKSITKPVETLLVADSLTGQDAVNIAKEFNEKVGVTGVILTRVDGDGRGGAALSMRMITGCPIKFVGVGEKLTEFEEFHADRIASRILGMGDIVTLVEKAQEVMDEDEAAKVAARMQKGVFTLNDLYSQLKNINKMGGVGKLMGMIPGVAKLKDKIESNGFGEKKIKEQMAIIESMTKAERRNPLIVNPSRKKRIAAGSGTKVEDVNKLLKQHQTMLKMMKSFGNMSSHDMEKMQRRFNV